MTVDLSPLDGLNRDELRHLVHKVAVYVDLRDIASARWEAAQAEYVRLLKIAQGAEDHATDLNIQCCTVKQNGKLLVRRSLARSTALKARQAADRAYRRQKRRWAELEKHFLKDAK